METVHEQEKVVSIPRIGEKAPEFKAVTTQGTINFPNDYKGKWVILFRITSYNVCYTKLLRTILQSIHILKIGTYCERFFKHVLPLTDKIDCNHK